MVGWGPKSYLEEKVGWNKEGKDTEVCGEHVQSILYTCMEMTLCNRVSFSCFSIVRERLNFL